MTNSRTNGSACATYRRMDSSQRSTLSIAANKLFDAAVCFVVCHLHGRMLREIGGGGMQHTANSAIESKFAAANRVDCYDGLVWRVFHRQFHVDFQRHIA